MKRKKIGIITICVLLFLGAMIFIVIRNGQRKDKEAIVEDTEKEQYAVTYVWPKNDLTEKIPEPKSKNGAVLHADDQKTKLKIYRTSYGEYNAYVRDCRKQGFIVNDSEKMGNDGMLLSQCSGILPQKNASGYLLWKKDKNFWISYDGIVTLGIDSSKLDVKVDGENVKIHIPEAKVLSSKPNPDSITKDSYYYAKNSAIADADDQTKAYKKAEKEMEKTAANDTVLLAQAQQRLQSMLEDYVKNMGTMLEKEYTITWDIKENHVKSDTAESTE